MAERGVVRLEISRSPGVREFAQLLNDLERAYSALYFLPGTRTMRDTARGLPTAFALWEYDVFTAWSDGWQNDSNRPIYPEDRLELARVSIQSPGWAEVVGALNPLQQIREYLNDRHERSKDRDWRGHAEKDKALLENDILRSQAERERLGTIKEFSDLLDQMGISQEERQRILWERLGLPLSRLGHHQDTGLLGPPQRPDSPD